MQDQVEAQAMNDAMTCDRPTAKQIEKDCFSSGGTASHLRYQADMPVMNGHDFIHVLPCGRATPVCI